MADEISEGPLRRLLHRVAPAVVAVLLVTAVWLLYREVSHYNFVKIRNAVYQIPRTQILLSLLLTVFNYLILIGYDLLAVKSIGHPLPLRRVALASFVGFATSYSFGALLGGGSVRYRFYTAWGLTAAEIVQLVVILGVTFWFGVFALAGVVFVCRPLQINPEWHLPFANVEPLGWLLILMAVAYLALTFFWKKPLRIRGRDAKLPGFAMSTAQLAVAAADLIVAAACFYVLLPRGVDMGYLQVLGIYLLAVVATVLTHIPGGVGIFDWIILTTSPVETKEQVAAALLLFRVIYFLLPLLGAAILFGLYELRLRSDRFRRLIGKSE